MSDALIASLNAQVQRLSDDKAGLQRALKQARSGDDGVKVHKARADELAAKLATVEKDRDALKAKAESGPADLVAKIKDLEGSLAARDHKDTFRDEALKAGVKESKVKDLYKLLDLKPGDAAVKAEDFAASLAAAKEAHDWAFGESTAAGGSTGAVAGESAKHGSQAISLGAPKDPAAGGGRGASVTTASTVKYAKNDLMQPGWQRANPKLVEALGNGSAVCTDAH